MNETTGLAVAAGVLLGTAALLGWAADKVHHNVEQRTGGYQWTLYLLFLFVAAGLSQLAEWAHLNYARTWPWYQAVAAALLVATAEYLVSVPANRLGLVATDTSYYLMSFLWNAFQVVTGFLLTALYFNQLPTWRNAVGLLLFVVGALLQVPDGDWPRWRPT